MTTPKISPKFKPLFGNDDRYYIITGGRGSSKSFSISHFLVLLILLEKGHTVLFTRYTMTSAHLSIIPEIIEKIQLLDLEREFEILKDEITCRRTGSKILFRGIKTSQGDQTANLKSLQGITTWVLDEGEELTDEKKFDTIDLSVRQKGIQNRVIVIMNPTSKEHWVYNRFFVENGVAEGSNLSKNNITYIHTTFLDNIKNLNKNWVDNVEKMKKVNPEKFKHTILGAWLDKSEGVIFTNWELGEFKDVGNIGFGMDFGFSNDPSTLVRISIDKKRKEIYIKEELYETGMTTSDIYDRCKDLVLKHLIIGDNSEPRLIKELKDKGLNIRECKKGAGSVREGLMLMMDYKLIIDPESKNMIRELNNYIWSDKKSGTPVDLYNDLIDACRYYVSNYLKSGNSLGISILKNY